MAQRLPRLRRDLDFFPSPDRRRPGLVIQDRNRFTDRQAIIPPQLVPALELFNGESTELDLRELLTRITGDLQVGEFAAHLQSALSEGGFLDDDAFASMKEKRLLEWRGAPEVLAAHSGPLNYPDDPVELRNQFDGWFGSPSRADAPAARAIAAPHASPGAAKRSYVTAYRQLSQSLTREQAEDRTFVILGTSHYGEIDRLGVTQKEFVTPAGRTRVNQEILNRLIASGGPGIATEDYYFQIEHSVEFQVVFLQYLFGPRIRILPMLCGSYAKSIYLGRDPETSEEVRRYLDALREMQEREGEKLVWVLGVDMSHMGLRYDDDRPMQAHAGEMVEVTARDQQRIDAIAAGNANEFWALVQQERDDLKWCGSAPFYTYLRAVPQARGTLLDYEHWQIDPQSVVTYGALRFTHS